MRALVGSYVNEYAQADSKDDKSALVARVLGEIQQLGGAFVKRHHTHANTWYVISTAQAREKVSQAFRELLHDQYKSSVDSRRILRQTKRLLCCGMDKEAAAADATAATTSRGTSSKKRRPSQENVSSSFSTPVLSTVAPTSIEEVGNDDSVAPVTRHPSFLGILDDEDNFSLLKEPDMEWLDKTDDDDVLLTMDDDQSIVQL